VGSRHPGLANPRLRIEGKTAAAIKNRRIHVRSIAALSRTARPTQLTPDTLSAIYTRQGWVFDYRCSVRSSVERFRTWAVETGTTEFNPAAESSVLNSPR
jgi:hypothetical protein